MFELMQFKLLLKKYQNIFSDILGDFELEKLENGEIVLKNKTGETAIVSVMGNLIQFSSVMNQLERRIVFRLPDKENEIEDIKVLETIKEVRPTGCIIEQIEKVYGFSIFSNKEKVLVDLVSKRYVFDENIDFVHSRNEKFLEDYHLLKTTFEVHMKTLVKPNGDLRYYTDSPYSTKTLLNDEDISVLYDIVDGKDKIVRIYDLYNGVINNRNCSDVLSIHLGLLRKDCFGYKETSGISEKENSICGRSNISKMDFEFVDNFIRTKIRYQEEFHLDDVNTLLNAITYRKSGVQLAKETIEMELGISYKEFDKLDFDEQEKLIWSHKQKRQINDDKVIMMVGNGEHALFLKVKKGSHVMIGSGEHSTFVEVGLTPEEERKKIDDKIMKILKKLKR